MSLELHSDQEVLQLAGRLDAAGARQLDAWLTEAGESPSVWDLSRLQFLSSAGIRCLAVLAKRVRVSGQRPRIVVGSSLVADTIRLTGLDDLWEIHPDIASALDTARRQAACATVDATNGSGGRRYRVTVARGTGAVIQFRAEEEGPPLLLRYDELGIAVGLGGFDAGPGHPPQSPGELFATGQAVFVRDAEGLTDYVSTITPRQTFAWVQHAVRFDAEPAERWDTDGPIRLEHLRHDLSHRASATGGVTWAAGIACEMDGGQSVLVLFHDGRGSTQILGLRGEGRQPAGGHPTLEKAASAVAGAASAEVITPCDAAELSAVRVWFQANPSIRDGANLRLRIETDEEYSDGWERIIRATFIDEARVRLSRLTGGYMAATYAAETTDRLGRRTLPTVLKITPRAVALREEAAHQQFVRPFILNNATILFGRATFGDYAGLRYNFVGITGAESRLQPLESLYLGDRFPEALAALRQTLTNVLDPWYGQAACGELRPFASHDPRVLFPHLPEAAQEALGIDPSAPLLACPPLGRELPNPYHFLRHRWDALLRRTESWAMCITHGDLNLNNILVDERFNIYVIDFSETRVRNVASDFARIEPIGMLQWTRLEGPDDTARILSVIESSLRGPVWTMPPAPSTVVEPLLLRAIALAAELRSLAARRVSKLTEEGAYLLPLLEWSLPIVAFRQIEPERKRLSSWASGLVLERLLQVMDLGEV